MNRPPIVAETGFSLAELMIATTVLLIVSGIAVNGLMQVTNTQKTIWNRTEMHSAVRSATELLQQEVGQAGRIALPGTPTITGAVATGSQTVNVSSASGMFVNENVVVGAGASVETVTLTAVNTASNSITATFVFAHPVGSPIVAYGGFASGIVPTNMANGSSGTVLKMYGDINSDGNMLYVEYTCDTTNHFLYRNSMPWNAASKPAVTSAQILLENIQPNPGGTPCFTYLEQTVTSAAPVNTNTYVTNVAITLTAQTGNVDPITRQYQMETKALLNVAPRNVFNVWELVSQNSLTRFQPMPASIANLLP